MHFVMGIIFTVIYVLLWGFGIGQAGWLWGMIFGILTGPGVELVDMPMMIKTHPRPPEIEGRKPMILIGALLATPCLASWFSLVYSSLSASGQESEVLRIYPDYEKSTITPSVNMGQV